VRTIGRVLRRLRIENLALIREAELDLAPGLNAITGETGAGKTILAQAIGLLLGARGDAALVGPEADEAYVEAELDLPDRLLDDEFENLAELRPEDEEGLVLARRVFADGRTRAYAWGRAAARDDVAAVPDSVIAMSGQFEQRRLARPSYQLDVLDAFCGDEQLRRRAEARLGWRELQAARRRHEELRGGADAAEARLAELRALVEDTLGMDADSEDTLRGERERLLHVTELATGVETASEALAPDDGEGAAALVAAAERAISPLESLAPELRRAGDELRDAELRLRETATELRSFLASSRRSRPARADRSRANSSDRRAKRRFDARRYEEPLARGRSSTGLEALEDGADPLRRWRGRRGS
jgi:DNA repair protein RecN (Recombination protein N)